MKIKPVLAAITTATAATVGLAGAPTAAADADMQYLGEQGELVNGDVVQGWTVSGLKPSTDTIPYPVAGTLWEATATDEAISGNVIPIVANLNARAESGQTYRVLFGVATPQGVNPATLAQGESTTGKVYFDVTGDAPDSVVYNAGGTDMLVWVEAPPAPPATSSTGGTPPSTGTYTAPAEAETTETPASEGDTGEAAPEGAGATMTPAPAGSSGTPLPEGSSGTPLPEGSSGTPLPEGSSGTALPGEATPAPVPAAADPAAPAGSAGTPLPEGASAAQAPSGSSGTPLHEGEQTAPAAPVTTTVVAPPPA